MSAASSAVSRHARSCVSRACVRLWAYQLAFACVLLTSCAEPQPAWLASREIDSFDDLDDVFARKIPGAVVEIAEGRTATASSALASCPEQHQPICRSVSRLVAAAALVARAPKGWFDFAAAVFQWHANELNRRLGRAALAYYVDVAIVENGSAVLPLIFSFHVEEIRRARIASIEVPVLVLRRVDSLNWEHRLVGFASRDVLEVVVLADAIDEELRAHRPSSGTNAFELWQKAIPDPSYLYDRTIAHELQHRADERPGTATSSMHIDNEEKAELSSYIAEMAHSPRSAWASVAWLISLCASEPRTMEGGVARSILERLLTHLEVRGSACDSTTWSSLPLDVDGERIAAAAAAIWLDTFGRPLPVMALTQPAIAREHKARRSSNK